MTPDEAIQAREVVSEVMEKFVIVVDGTCKQRHERSNAVALEALKVAQGNQTQLAMLIGDHRTEGRIGTVERDVGAAHTGLRALGDKMEAGLDRLGDKLDRRFDEQSKQLWQLSIKVAGGLAVFVALAAALARAVGAL